MRRMSWFILLGIAMTGWTLLLILSAERRHKLHQIETRRRERLAVMEKQRKKEAEIPVIG